MKPPESTEHVCVSRGKQKVSAFLGGCTPRTARYANGGSSTSAFSESIGRQPIVLNGEHISLRLCHCFPRPLKSASDMLLIVWTLIDFTFPALHEARSHPWLGITILLLSQVCLTALLLRRTLTGEDAEGFSDLCPELNLEDLSADPHATWSANKVS